MLGVQQVQHHQHHLASKHFLVLSMAGHQATCFVDKLSEWLPTPLCQVHFPTPVLWAEMQRD